MCSDVRLFRLTFTMELEDLSLLSDPTANDCVLDAGSPKGALAWTPLQFACALGDEDLVVALLEKETESGAFAVGKVGVFSGLHARVSEKDTIVVYRDAHLLSNGVRRRRSTATRHCTSLSASNTLQSSNGCSCTLAPTPHAARPTRRCCSHIVRLKQLRAGRCRH